MCKSASRDINHCSSQAAKERDLYSASVELLETVFCFLALHEIREVPRKKQYPDVDLLVSTQFAQSASAKPSNWIVEVLEKNNPLPGVPLRYLTTLQAVS
jgi:hypothetical protein